MRRSVRRVPLYRIDADDGDELGLRLSDEDPQPGDRIELDGRWYVVTLRHDLPPGDLGRRDARGSARALSAALD